MKASPPIDSLTEKKARRLYIPWIIVVLGLAAALAAFMILRKRETRNLDLEFNRRASIIANLLTETLRNRQETLLTLRELFHYSEEVTRAEFEHAARDLLTRHPGVIALKWAPRIPAVQRTAFEAAARASHLPNFTIFAAPAPPIANDSEPSTTVATTPDAFPLYFQITHEKAPPFLGLDLATTTAWPDFAQAAATGNLRASGLIAPLTTDASLIEVAVYRDAVPATEPKRLAQLRGFVLGIFQPSAILEDLLTHFARPGIDVLMIERSNAGTAQPLHYHPANPANLHQRPSDLDAFAAGQHTSIGIPFAGGRWEMWFRPDDDWLTSQRTASPFAVAFFTLIVTGLLALSLRNLFQQALAVEALVAQRTAELTATQKTLQEDIQRRTRIEQALKASEERYRTLITQSSDAIWRLELPEPFPIGLPLDEQVQRILDTGLIAECNNLTAQLYGRHEAGEIFGQKLTLLTSSNTKRHEALFNAFVRGGYKLSEHESAETTTGGETRIFTHHLIGVLENHRLARIWVTERELTQQRLIEQEKQAFERRLGDTQRLESLGVLAGGIAHDFNNLLTGILGHASLGRTTIDADSPLNSHLEEIEAASLSAASLCQQMLAYAGKGRFVVKPYDLTQIVTQTAHLLHVSISKQAELRFQLADDLPPVMADATQIQQIVMNLVINASEAIGQRQGLVRITTGLIHPDTTTFTSCPYAPEKPAPAYVFLEVSDNGTGMSPDVLTRIFEPFFTTKFAGRGLGLAAALGIVRSHSGALRVESKLGEGTTFTLFLPATQQRPGEEKNNPSNSPWIAEGTLLVIDDEAPVRSIAQRMGQSLGFSALSAANGTDGIELFKRYTPSITVVLLDLSMPGLSGEETLERLRAAAPDVRVVMMSGYNQPNLALSKSGKLPVFLSKPFSMAQFQSALRQAIKHG